MLSFFLKPNRILAGALLLIVCSLFIIPVHAVDKHIISLLFMVYCFIAYYRVKKNGVEFYSERVQKHQALLFVSLVWILSLLMLETNIKMEWYENSVVIRYALNAIGVLYASLFFYKVFWKK
jgi:hypothetical protein